MMKSLLLFLLLSSPVLAEDQTCHEAHISVGPDLFTLAQTLEWSAADDNDVKTAPCVRKEPFSQDEMLTWLDENQSDRRTARTIKGISFEGESEENLRTFEMLTKPVSEFLDPDLKVPDFTSNCKKVVCAVKEIFGPEVGVQLLYMHRKYGLNGSQYARKESDLWRKEELDTVLLALSDFPEGVLPFEENRPLVHYSRGVPNGLTYANVVIQIFDYWGTQSKEMQRYTITHEIGHALGMVTGVDNNPRWMGLSGWHKTTKVINGRAVEVYEAGSPEKTASLYARSNQMEDFAESVAGYRYNPENLRRVSPEKYELIKNIIFDGVEYTSETACQNPSRRSHAVAAQVNEVVKDWQPSEQEMLAMAQECNPLAVRRLAAEGEIDVRAEEFTACYESAVTEVAQTLAKEYYENRPDGEFMGPMFRNVRIEVPPERLQAIANDARSAHLNSLRAVLTSYLSVPLNCELSSEHAYQDFNEETLGIDTFALKTEFTAIAQKACEEKKNYTTVKQQVHMMVKNNWLADVME